MNMNNIDVINMDMNNMCNACKNVMCGRNAHGVSDIISYVRSTEMEINKLNRKLERLSREINIANNQYEQRQYALLAQKELLNNIELKLMNIDYTWKEREYHKKISNMLNKVRLEVDEEFDIITNECEVI